MLLPAEESFATIASVLRNFVIIGHRHILNFFDSAILDGRLSHAYGFVGPGGIGKRAVAFEVAARLLNVPTEKLANHPDFILVQRGEDEKTGKLKKEITVAEARELKKSLQHTSWQKGNRVVVIDGAEFLNSESGNALLKLLEEPPERTYFILLIEDEGGVLPTVRSRLQSFYFSLVKTAEIAAALKKMGIPDERAESYARRAHGRPGKALFFLESENAERYDDQLAVFQQLIGAPFYKKIQLIEKFYGAKEDGERGRTEWQEILETWVFWFRDWLLKKHGAVQFAGEPGLSASTNFSSGELVRIIDSCQRVKKLLRQNVHPRLAIEEALLKI